MNELNLFFDENELIRLYKIDLDTSKKNSWKSLKKWLLIMITVFITGFILFGIGLYYHSLIPFGIALCLVSFFSLIYLIIKFVIIRKKLNKIFAIPKDFIEKYNNLENVKYIYDNLLIKYLEEEKVRDIFEWQKIKSIDNDVHSIILSFSDSPKLIWIPKKMTKEDELIEFENMINSIKKTTNNMQM